MHKVGCITFAWVNPRCKNHSTSESNFFWSAQKVGNDYHFTIITGKSFCQNSFPNLVLCFVCTKSLEQLTAVRVCIRVAHGAVDFVIIVLEGYLKSQCMIIA